MITNSDAALRWLSRPTPDLEEVHAALKRVNRDANLASAVIARIRKFLRTGDLKRELIQVKPLLDELLQMLNNTLVEAEITVNLNCPQQDLTIMADPVQLQQVILNLIMNAVDAMRELSHQKRLLTITVQTLDVGGIQVAVQDNGLGIKAGTESKLFDAFFSTKTQGLGMGLAISRSIIENHGGRLWFEHASLKGACFMFTLPNE